MFDYPLRVLYVDDANRIHIQIRADAFELFDGDAIITVSIPAIGEIRRRSAALLSIKTAELLAHLNGI